MPSRPVLIGRGLVPHPHTNKNTCEKQRKNTSMSRVHYPTPNNPRVDTQLHTPRHTPRTQPRHTWVTQSYGGHSDRETPGPIPNPEVKPASADGTAPERWWESRTPPNIHSNRGHPRGGLCCVGGPDWLPRHPQHHSDDPREGDHPWPTSDATRVPPVDPAAAAAAAGHSSGPPRPPGAAAAPRRAPGTSATVTRLAVSAAPGPARVRPARVTGHGRPRSSVRAPSTRRRTTGRRSPRRSPAPSSTARSAGSSRGCRRSWPPGSHATWPPPAW